MNQKHLANNSHPSCRIKMLPTGKFIHMYLGLAVKTKDILDSQTAKILQQEFLPETSR